jgi:hypothetical protein
MAKLAKAGISSTVTMTGGSGYPIVGLTDIIGEAIVSRAALRFSAFASDRSRELTRCQ